MECHRCKRDVITFELIQFRDMDQSEHFCNPCHKYLEAKGDEIMDDIARKIQEFKNDDCC